LGTCLSLILYFGIISFSTGSGVLKLEEAYTQVNDALSTITQELYLNKKSSIKKREFFSRC